MSSFNSSWPPIGTIHIVKTASHYDLELEDSGYVYELWNRLPALGSNQSPIVYLNELPCFNTMIDQLDTLLFPKRCSTHTARWALQLQHPWKQEESDWLDQDQQALEAPMNPRSTIRDMRIVLELRDLSAMSAADVVDVAPLVGLNENYDNLGQLLSHIENWTGPHIHFNNTGIDDKWILEVLIPFHMDVLQMYLFNTFDLSLSWRRVPIKYHSWNIQLFELRLDSMVHKSVPVGHPYVTWRTPMDRATLAF